MVDKAEFYKSLLEKILSQVEYLLGVDFTNSMLEKSVGEFIRSNRNVWKKKEKLPKRLRKVVR